MRTLQALVLLHVAAGCGAGGGNGFPPAWVGTDQALRTATMSGEEAPGEIPRETVVDEATLDYLDAQSACFDVILRAAVPDDVPLHTIGARCTSGQASAEADVNNALVSVYDYDDRGDVDTVLVEDTTPQGYEDAGLDPPAEGLFRVVERKAHLCCTIASAEAVTLEIDTARFSWDLR